MHDAKLATGSDSGGHVSLRGVTKRYSEVRALDGIGLEVEGGEFITLLGASGSGKSTLLNIVAGFTTPTGGQVEVDGQDLAGVPPHRRNLGMVFQNYALFPHMSVFDNVAFPLRRRRLAKDDVRRRVHETLDLVELGALAKRRPSELSGGQQQRVALARAIVFQPPVLLMDEPLGALDKRLREQLQLELKRLHQELKTTFVFVTHDQDEALAMSDRIALLRDGRLVQHGTPQQLYEKPNCVYTADFIGESNIFRGRLEGTTLTDATSGLTVAVAASPSSGTAALVVRPENLRIVPAGTPVPSGCNALDGAVSEVTYAGANRRLGIRTRDGHELVARGMARDQGDRTLGSAVIVYWQPDDGVLMPDDDVSERDGQPVPLG